jgi:hypothetical protein
MGALPRHTFEKVIQDVLLLKPTVKADGIITFIEVLRK